MIQNSLSNKKMESFYIWEKYLMYNISIAEQLKVILFSNARYCGVAFIIIYKIYTNKLMYNAYYILNTIRSFNI